MTVVLGEIQFTKIYLQKITVIFPLFWIFFGKKITLQNEFLPHGYKTFANLKQFVIIIKRSTMIATLD